MATKTRAEMIDRILERLGVKAAGQSATDEDSDLVGDALDTLHDQLKQRGLAPYATSAFPAWAQRPVIKMVAYEVAADYGVSGQRLMEFAQGATDGDRELCEQMQAQIHHNPVRAKYY